jgi:RNA polymerase sigma-70 factor (ECF subfamily)
VVTHDDGATQGDDDLVVRAKGGDEQALGELVAWNHAVVYRVVLGIVRDPDLAADTAQDTFLKAFRGLVRFEGRSAFRTWLLAIATNEARGALRGRGRRRETSLDHAPADADHGYDVQPSVVTRDEAERIRRLVERLPEKQRLAVQLRAQEGLSFREVGRVIGSSEGAARVNYHHGIKRLRAWIEE